jgi:hypothetical protein
LRRANNEPVNGPIISKILKKEKKKKDSKNFRRKSWKEGGLTNKSISINSQLKKLSSKRLTKKYSKINKRLRLLIVSYFTLMPCYKDLTN